MRQFCTQCGAETDSEDKFCARCGAAVRPVTPAPTPAAESIPTTAPAPTPAPKEDPAPIQNSTPAPVPTPPPATSSKPAPKKKKKKKGCLIAFFVTLFITALLTVLACTAGSYLMLSYETDRVANAMNGGDFDLSDFQRNVYKDMPLYVLEMVGETEKDTENGPIVKAMAPYLSVERTKIDGFLSGKREVEFRILSRDLSGWILSQDYKTFSTPEELQQAILEYIPQAPVKEYYVTVTYYREGFFDWKGNFEIPEFADAISGGLNTAYNALYDRMIEEMEDLLG